MSARAARCIGSSPRSRSRARCPNRARRFVAEDEKEVGEITSSAILPLPGGDRSVALGYLRREAAGKDLRAGTAKLKPASAPIA